MIFLVFSKLSELCGVMKYHLLRYSAFDDGYSGLADNPEGVAYPSKPYKELSNIEMQPPLGFSPALVFSLEG